ncbi:MAG TPA: T9SS type A sorting domain-containing protein [Ignavibacteriaceae bacterium]|nr:T9SS type A sorting domain-containing protein [Ignavibacteriaceae bacterium]
MFSKKSILMLLIFSTMGILIHAQSKGMIAFAMRMDSTIIDTVTGELPDMTWVHALQDSGYEVDTFYTPALSAASEGLLDTLLNADLVIIGRSVPTTTLGGNSADDKYAWNDLTVPILTGNMWAMRSSRLNWFNTTSISTLTDTGAIYYADIIDPTDSVFQGLDLNTSEPVPWVHGSGDVLGTTDAGYGYLIASFTEGGDVAFVRFEPNQEFYTGAVDAPAGWRSYIGNGRDNSSQPPYYYFNFTPESKKVFYAEVAHMIKLGGGPKTGVKHWRSSTVPSTLVLFQNYPNPFNPATTIAFSLPERSRIKLLLYDALGTIVKEIASGDFEAGFHDVKLNASDLASGIYFYKLSAGSFAVTKKLVVIK